MTDNGQPSMEVVTITPAMARKWLENLNYEDNRNIKQLKVDDLARQIAKGLWRLNGDAIRFDTEGYMIDGQHRCAAVMAAGKSIQTFVCRGVETQTFTTIDRGWARSNAQILQMQGEKYVRALAGAARLAYLWLCYKNLDSREAEVSADEVALILEEYPTLRDAAKRIYQFKVNKILSGGFATFAAHLFYRASESKAETFFEGVGSGADLGKGSPMLVLRARLQDAKAQRKRWRYQELFSMTIRAWNAHYRNKPIHILRLFTKSLEGVREIQVPAIQGLPD